MNALPRAAAQCLVPLLLASSVNAQKAEDEPSRPKLSASADTNDAAAYYSFGVSQMRRNPRTAAEAFYWSTRIDPTQPLPYYARRVALLVSNPRTLVRYMAGDRRTLRSDQVQAADSLYRHALMLQPFLPREHDRHMLDAYVAEWARQIQSRNTRSTDAGTLEYIMEEALRRAGPELRGWIDYSEGNLPGALHHYERALAQSSSKAPLHADRAQIFYMLGRSDEAAGEMTAALQELNENERDNDVFLYYSKAFYELGLGMSLEASQKYDQANAAYGRALQEDLSYYPAHRRMAMIALAQGDTAAALASLSLGAAMDEADTGLRCEYAMLLLETGAAAEAEAQMRRVVEQEPYFAQGWYLLGVALDALGNAAPAADAYDAFLLRAQRNHPERSAVTARAAALRQQATDAP